MPLTLNAEQRRERAQNAAKVRWQHTKDTEDFWNTAPIDQCESRIGQLREEVEKASKIVQQRYAENHNPTYKCDTCGNSIPSGRWAQQRTRRDLNTGLPISIFFCSQKCISLYNHKVQGTYDLPK